MPYSHTDKVDGNVLNASTWNTLAQAVEWDTTSVYDVREYGALGDGSTDDGPAFQAAVDAVPSDGAIVSVPAVPAAYRIATPVDCKEKGVIFRGTAVPFWSSSSSVNVSNAGSKINISGAITGFTNDGGGTTTIDQRGVAFEYLGFEQDPPTAYTATAVHLKRTNRWRFDRCHFRGFYRGILIDSDVTGASPNNDNAWSTIIDCHFLYSTHCIETIHTYGFTVLGGSFVVSTPLAQTGMYLLNGEHVRIIGAKFDNGIGIDLRSGNYVKIVVNQFERCDIGLRVGEDVRLGLAESFAADSRFLYCAGNTFGGEGSSDGHEAIVLSTHARAGHFAGNEFTNIQTKLTDNSHGQHMWVGSLPEAGWYGVRFPEVDAAQAPTAGQGRSGDMINVDGVLKVHNGASWVTVGAQT